MEKNMTQEAVKKIALISPGGNSEAEYYGFEDRINNNVKIYMFANTLPDCSDEELLDTLVQVGEPERVAAVAEKTRGLGIDSVVWTCTAGSFLGGPEWSAKQLAAMSEASGCPASSTSRAFVHSLQNLNIKKVSILNIFDPEMGQKFADFIASFGISVVNILHADSLSDESEFESQIDWITDSLVKADRAEAGAILFPCTALPSLNAIEAAEAIINKPVLTGNQVSLWDAVRLSGIEAKAENMGMLFK
ncbi:MAG: maleate cis-trans isomerase [Gammaproteobacteria bacterium]